MGLAAQAITSGRGRACRRSVLSGRWRASASCPGHPFIRDDYGLRREQQRLADILADLSAQIRANYSLNHRSDACRLAVSRSSARRRWFLDAEPQRACARQPRTDLARTLMLSAQTARICLAHPADRPSDASAVAAGGTTSISMRRPLLALCDQVSPNGGCGACSRSVFRRSHPFGARPGVGSGSRRATAARPCRRPMLPPRAARCQWAQGGYWRDDDPATRSLLRGVLSVRGIRCSRRSRTGARGLELALEIQPQMMTHRPDTAADG